MTLLANQYLWLVNQLLVILVLWTGGKFFWEIKGLLAAGSMFCSTFPKKTSALTVDLRKDNGTIPANDMAPLRTVVNYILDLKLDFCPSPAVFPTLGP